jgi:predicted RNA-binding protein YlxR (DUF448 family)
LQTKPRRVPQRTCVACRSTSGKRDFVRIVRTPSGAVEVDETGKKAGRGAYLCASPACWAEALKKGRLDSALRVKLSADDRLRLTQYATTIREAVTA